VARRSPLEKIEVLTVRMAELEADRERVVAAAMTGGATWAEIGGALGVSAQAAHKRYRWLRHSRVTGECWYEPPLAGATRHARR
jgi:transposase-like protein